ncbi:NEL-type E3 ubiquitin ligase domain-containing protein [Pseudomonas sp.]|jgi:Leucine-rich repeat (LRR) protein|uniref:NEL-type E3 ubiquitin ligase domain-containing protein n=1 Tax=Pseudomonas sp. TaxID=306 RepID=UPI002E300C59|nr:NEL-type E3 ubiquitin ligase domain-containing protein [Pseudomonas sp.]HEX4549704.1 NEL-type E3 ubiquitin ligase domain-containing protein [Pseudomonas sp.]
MSDTTIPSTGESRPVPHWDVTSSIHSRILFKSTPQWLIDATPERRAQFKSASVRLPSAWSRASPQQRQRLQDCFAESFKAQTELDKVFSGLLDVETFARPLLTKALKKHFGVELDKDIPTWIALRKSVKISLFEFEAWTYDFLKLELLQAALHNFEEKEGKQDFFDSSSGFRWRLTAGDSETFYGIPLGLKVHQFIQLCRTLDLGGQYRAYLTKFFYQADPDLRSRFIGSQKAALRAAAELALLQGDVDNAEYAMVLSVINGEKSPRLRGKPVWLGDLRLKDIHLTGCLTFSIVEDDGIKRGLVYIPHDPHHALKSYSGEQMHTTFRRLFTQPDPPGTAQGTSTAYQRFFSQFVDYAARPEYFRLFTKDSPDATAGEWIGSNLPSLRKRIEQILSINPSFEIKDLPPFPVAPQVADPDFYLEMSAVRFKNPESRAEPLDPWDYLYEQHQAKCMSDAAAHAVPTADIDAAAREKKLAALLEFGMFFGTFALGFVPVLGEVMMAVMAAQLLTEVVETAIEWSEGDHKAAKAHMIDLAENLAMIGLMAGAGKVLGKPGAKPPALKQLNPEPVIEALKPVQLPDGQTRLWKPDLRPYVSDVRLPTTSRPDATGRYEFDGRFYIRMDDRFYQITFDPALKKWRISHPADSRAYAPVLEHNSAGAWRHAHERPLSWDRTTLLRRLGHDTEQFSDRTLGLIGDVCGISDDALRRVHMDGLPIPAILADRLEQVRVDQNVQRLIRQVGKGDGRDPHYMHAVPLAIELPGWPEGRVLEVRDGDGSASQAQLYGTPREGGTTVRISRADLRHGRFAERALSGLSEEQIEAMLGPRASWGVRHREQVFNQRLADLLKTRRAALFDALAQSAKQHTDSGVPSLLQRRYPSLSRRAHDQLLDSAHPQELIELREHARISRRLNDQARIAVQQGRLSRAIAGLYREGLANADSDRLALHVLEQLPGWSADIRLEVREGSIHGTLLDSIGSEQAGVRRCLVKDGDRFRLFDEAGKELRPLDPAGRQFFKSIVKALPEKQRTALRLPATRKAVGLQRRVAAHARTHRIRMMESLKLRMPRSRPSLRLPGGRFGYELSGRGQGFGMDAAQVAHVRDLYPHISEQEAQAFIRQRMRAGESNQQISATLARRQRELDGLRATLEHALAGNEDRAQVINDMIDCWRQGLDRDRPPEAVLRLRGDTPLPALNADFSHVRTLNMSGARLLAEGDTLLRTFANVQRIELHSVQSSELEAVTARLAGLARVTELSIFGLSLEFSEASLQSLQNMTSLEQLSLIGDMETLDVSRLASLRKLEVSGSLTQWPVGVSGLEHLQSLDLWATQIKAVPPELFAGHERLWRGLKMNWADFTPQDVARVFDYLQDNRAHLVDEPQWVQQYCADVLRNFRPDEPFFVDNILAEFQRQGLSPAARLERINNLRIEHAALESELSRWSDVESGDRFVRNGRLNASHRILECWHEGLERRFTSVAGSSSGADAAGTRLDLSDLRLEDAPRLPPEGFNHVRELNLSRTGLPLESTDGWLSQFAHVETLNLAQNNLPDLPVALEHFTALQHLDFSRNWLQVTAEAQARLNGLNTLSTLQLRYNPLTRLDVGRLVRLRSLDLSHSAIEAWPEGVLELPQLSQLDISHSAITDIPENVQQGHDALLMNTNLRGCRLSASARVNARRFARRVNQDNPAHPLENPLGIPRGALAQGQTGGVPEYFPEFMFQRPEIFQALEPADAEVALPLHERLRRLTPELDTEEAESRLGEWIASASDEAQIEVLLSEWEAQFNQWVKLLNDWIEVPGYFEDNPISALDRRRAADRLLTSWRGTLRPSSAPALPEGSHVLDLSGLQIGSLPELPWHFSHVTELNLSHTGLMNQGADAFLQGFTRVESLNLSHNNLDVLPETLGELRSMRVFNARHNRLQDYLQTRLPLLEMPHLRALDLSYNMYNAADVTGLRRLASLNLEGNLLGRWPVAALELPRLRELDLSENMIVALPSDIFEPRHRSLVQGTDVSVNPLREQECENLRIFLESTGEGLGFTLSELDELIEWYRGGGNESSNSSREHSQSPHPETESAQVQKDRWFVDVSSDEGKHRVWDDLYADADSRDFFFILSQLRHARDFQVQPEQLRRRVWAVLDAISNNSKLREEVFAKSTAMMNRYTCGDGRIMIFNDLESTILEAELLPLARTGSEGETVYKKVRGMVRLQAVEDIARTVSNRNPHIDSAEIRLAFRIGLADRLELPPQPASMRYYSGVTQLDISEAAVTILNGEASPDFDQRLIQRESWREHLQARYANEFSALELDRAQEQELIDERLPDAPMDSDAYFARNEAYQALMSWYKERREALLIRLSRQERERLEPARLPGAEPSAPGA